MYKVKRGNLTFEYDYKYAKAYSYDNLIVKFEISEIDAICSFNYDLLNHSKTTSSHYTKSINAFCKKHHVLDNNIKNFYHSIKAIQKDNPQNLSKLYGFIGGYKDICKDYKNNGILYVSYTQKDI